MKKFFMLTLCLILLVTCMASCNKPKSQDNTSTIPVPNADPKKAEETLEAAGYEVILVEVKEPDKDGIVASLLASKGADDYVLIHYFDTKENAKVAYDKLKKTFDKAKENAEKAGKEFNDICAMFGKMVYTGTPNAIMAAQ